MTSCRAFVRYVGKKVYIFRRPNNNFACKQCFSSANNSSNRLLHHSLPALSKKTTYPTTKHGHGSRLSVGFSGQHCISHHNYSTSEDETIDIDVEKMVSLMKEDDTFVIDVREEEEIEAFGAVPRAINIPMGDLVQALELSPRHFRSQYKMEPPDPDNSLLIFLCAKGFRSHAAVMMAKELGFSRCCHLPGGYELWQESREGGKL